MKFFNSEMDHFSEETFWNIERKALKLQIINFCRFNWNSIEILIVIAY